MKIIVFWGFLLLFLITIISGVFGEVRINEVTYNPACTGDDCEYVEIYSDSNINITFIEKSGSSNKTFNITLNNGYNIITPSISAFIGNWSVTENIFELSIALANNDNIWIYENESLISSLINFESYGANGNSKSLQYCSGNWTENYPTPGMLNNCTAPTQTCTQSFSCSNSSCISSSLTQTCYNITSSCQSINTTQTFSCGTSTPDTYLQLNWTDKIYSDEEFEIEVKAINLLSYDYDLKIWIEFKTNSTMLSERYDSENDEWKSGTYYINRFFTGSGNRTKDAKIRMKEDYQNFDGEAKIYARLRRNDNQAIMDDIERTIDISESESSSSSGTSNTNTQTASNQNISNEGIIILGSSDSKKTEKSADSIIYKSKMEYIKDYAPYALSVVCIAIIILLMLDKKRR